MSTGHVGEIFSGIQGEGLCLGRRQIFIRLVGCNLRCSYCDTAWARERTPYCRVERTPGERDFEERANPMSAEDAAAAMVRLHSPASLHDSVSFTGGEPLLQPDFARDLAQCARALGLETYLETNGTLVEPLLRVLDVIDVVAMDVKLPSAAGFECWQAHELFLKAALGRIAQPALLFVKAVFAETTTEQEIERLGCLLQASGADIPLVLQPVSLVAGGPKPPSPGRALALQALAKRFVREVRVIPQMHKLMGQL
jgi:7-carboxy-7-deazaguanine synthase